MAVCSCDACTLPTLGDIKNLNLINRFSGPKSAKRTQGGLGACPQKQTRRLIDYIFTYRLKTGGRGVFLEELGERKSGPGGWDGLRARRRISSSNYRKRQSKKSNQIFGSAVVWT
jgi:hypothetical protein